jgi:hypothetical protein
MVGSESASLNNQFKENQYASASKSALTINSMFKLPFTTAELPSYLSSLLVKMQVKLNTYGTLNDLLK